MKRVKITALFIAICYLVLSMGVVLAQNEQNEIKNIIYMIPDGGGINPLQLADAVKMAGGLNDKEIYPYVTKTGQGHLHLTDYLVGAITTYCADNDVTDSAAAGTALSTGHKANTGNIGLDKDLKPCATILEISQKLGKKTGMVSTYDWSNATPASFSAHNESRSNNGILSEQTVNQGIDVILGVGFAMSGWRDIGEAEKRDYKIINNREELQAISSGDRIWGNLELKQSPFDIDNTAETVTLKEMTEAAIKALSNEDNGFFLMVEGSRVDGGGHNNDAKAMIGDYLAFDEAFGAAVNFAKGRNDTVVIACPDHDTGGMILPDDLSEAVTGIQRGEENPGGIGWTTTGHTAQNGGLSIYIPDWLEYPTGIDASSATPYDSNVIDNTDIFSYLTSLLGVNGDDYTKQLFVDVTEMGKFDQKFRLFSFNDYPVTVKQNASYAFLKDSAIDLGGEVCVYANERFYVPQKLLDIINGNEEPVPFDIECPVAAHFEINIDSAKSTNVALKLKNCTKESVTGVFTIQSPETIEGNIDFELSAEEEKSLSIGFSEIDINGFMCYYEIALGNGKVYSCNETVDGILYAAYTDTPITVDGIISDKQWENAPKFVCDDVSMTVGMTNWKGFRDLSSVFSILYDEENLYFYSVVTDEIFCQNTPDELYKGDSIQLGLYDDTEGLFAAKVAGNKFEDINFGYCNGEPIANRTRRTGTLVEKGRIKGNGFEFQCVHEGDDLTYEIKIPWNVLFGYELDTDSVKMLAFSYLSNDNDGEGRRGAMERGGGIYSGKDVNKFLKLYLVKDMGISENKGISVYYQDEKIDMISKPFLKNERTMISANEFLDKAGIEYSEDTETGAISISNIVIGNEEMTVDGEKQELDTEPFFMNNTVFAPIRALCEALGKTVEWQQDSLSVYVK